jgi:NAD(P)-dependent dehydrogenase (short-subunit alcohol dehydrogenase family)
MKNILLIGGSYGIGAAITKQLKDTHKVYVASRTQDNMPQGVTHMVFDALTDDITTLPLPEQIDGLVYCPGSINLKPFKRIKPQAFQEDLEVNFLSLVKVIQGLLPRLTASQQASLVFFSTVAVKEGFAKALAAEYAPKMRINVIAPSLTDTPLAGRLLSSDDKKQRMGEMHPLKRIGTTADIANTACFLLSDKSSWMTGQVLAIDGGKSTLQTQ